MGVVKSVHVDANNWCELIGTRDLSGIYGNVMSTTTYVLDPELPAKLLCGLNCVFAEKYDDWDGPIRLGFCKASRSAETEPVNEDTNVPFDCKLEIVCTWRLEEQHSCLVCREMLYDVPLKANMLKRLLGAVVTRFQLQSRAGDFRLFFSNGLSISAFCDRTYGSIYGEANWALFDKPDEKPRIVVAGRPQMPFGPLPPESQCD